MFHYTSCGLQNIWLKNGYTEYDTNYGKGISIHNLGGLHKVIGLYVVRNKPNVSGAEVRYLRIELDLPQVQLANILGVGESSIRNWENHRGKITKPAERLLRVLYYEHVSKNSNVRKLIDRINQLNREDHHHKLEFEECGEKWCEAA